ncbi:polysaccharide deacetylase family protein [Methylobacterium organophilum]|uniref:polysaccharide deacetylase family protein n=1 Tax=Methylobacterium organophilum TaxID=410 RepID=UPI001F1400B3|nr:polysaccharide deacetylase family protein [Methylobacterium organophilum]UMY19627.1 polysaccharide deacetylase family protein [Methylobacterium organophilum]
MGPLPREARHWPSQLRARLAHRVAMHVAGSTVLLKGREPLVSLTFDDVPDSACTTGVDLLEAYGAKGTFYIAGKLVDTPSEHWRNAGADRLAALHRAGHEIGCHTESHAFVPMLGRRGFAGEVGRNRATLRSFGTGIEPRSFAFPYGYGSVSAKRVVRDVFATGRSIIPGVNAGRVDRCFLRANPLIDGALDAGEIDRLMDEALAKRGWLIFYGHDVTPAPSPYGCRPELLEAVLRAASARGIACVTMDEARRRAF